jgi:hypothetical protein
MMPDWLSNDMFLALGILSAVFFVGTLIVIPILLVRLPVDYFHDTGSRSWLHNWHPVLRVTAYMIKNAIGIVFLLAGVAMLLLPGQGILTILIGISLIDFPGKRRLERALLGRPSVLGAINRIRAKFGKPPLREPAHEQA